MSNPFANWSPEQVAAHNARVGGSARKEVMPPEQPRKIGTARTIHEGAVTTGERASENTRQLSTNLVLTPSTDEQKLNKLERDWLRHLRLTHPHDNIGVQNITLKLGNDCRYNPDFWTIDANGQLFFWETKGFRVRLGQAKIIIAARQFRHFRFVLVERKKGQWIETPIQP